MSPTGGFLLFFQHRRVFFTIFSHRRPCPLSMTATPLLTKRSTTRHLPCCKRCPDRLYFMPKRSPFDALPHYDSA